MRKSTLFLTMLSCFISFITLAQVSFTPGNLVVLRVGDGTVPIDQNFASGHPLYSVFLDEYTTSGTLVQSIAMPTAVNGTNQIFTLDALTLDLSEETGALNLSPNGQWLTAMGYNVFTFPGSSSIRTIGLINYTGTVNTSTLLTDAGRGFPYSAVTTNGIDLWGCSARGGIRYATTGSSTSTVVATPTFPELYRGLGISNNQLFVTTTSGELGTVGTGLPTSGEQTITNLPGIPDFSPSHPTSQSQFFFADMNSGIPGDDVVYVANSTGFALKKYSFDGTTWIDNGTIGTDEDNYFGITGKVNGSTVTLYCTRKINEGVGPTTLPSPDGNGELVTLTDASGYNGAFVGMPTVIATHAFQTMIRGVAFAPVPPSVKVSAKAFLQGAYNTSLSRHKDVTTTWANVLNVNALTQPFNVAPFNYTGTEQVSTGFFTSNSGATTDITDWVLVELRDGSNPATLISRKAAFIREDGQIVATDGGPITLTAPAGDGNYYITVRHRNHLAIRSANPIALNGNTTTVYDFTTSQSQAYQNPSVTGNTAMATKDLPGTETGKFLLWGGNANGDGFIRASGASNVSDYLTLLGPLCLQGDFSKILNSVYRKEDMNLDGVTRASAALNVNDYITLLSTGILAGNTSNIIAAH